MPESATARDPAPPFPEDSIKTYLLQNAAALRAHPSGNYIAIADSLDASGNRISRRPGSTRTIAQCAGSENGGCRAAGANG